MNNGNEVAACWLMDAPRFSADVHLTSLNMQLATPQGWHYENSLSASTKFVANEEKLEKLKFLRQEDSKDIYLDISSGICPANCLAALHVNLPTAKPRSCSALAGCGVGVVSVHPLR
jgi:hypothetical protein